MTLIFGNFPETLGMSGSLENSQTSIFLHRLGCGTVGLKFFCPVHKKSKTRCVGFWLFWLFLLLLFFFCMIWSYIIIFSPPEHRKHHLNLKWGDLIFWFRNLSCTHFATFQHKAYTVPKNTGIPGFCKNTVPYRTGIKFLIPLEPDDHSPGQVAISCATAGFR